METTNDILNKHLPTKMKEQIDAAFPSNQDSLLDGVNYSHQGKTWHIRIGLDKDDTGKVNALFVCVHSEDRITYNRFAYLETTKEKDREIHWIKYDEYRLFEGKIDIGASENQKIDRVSSNIPSGNKFLHDFLTDGEIDNNAETPKVSKKTLDFHRYINKQHQPPVEIIPEVASDILKPSTPSKKSNSYNGAVACIFLIALVVISYKGACYAKDKWYPQPKPPVTPPNVPITPTRAI